jgi:hypothetical protein
MRRRRAFLTQENVTIEGRHDIQRRNRRTRRTTMGSGFSRIGRNPALEELTPTCHGKFFSVWCRRSGSCALEELAHANVPFAPLGGTFAPKKLTSAEVDIDEMRRTNHISLARVAANGAAPPGAQA